MIRLLEVLDFDLGVEADVWEVIEELARTVVPRTPSRKDVEGLNSAIHEDLELRRDLVLRGKVSLEHPQRLH